MNFAVYFINKFTFSSLGLKDYNYYPSSLSQCDYLNLVKRLIREGDLKHILEKVGIPEKLNLRGEIVERIQT